MFDFYLFRKAIFAFVLILPFVLSAQENDSLQYPFTNQNGGLYLDSPIQYSAEYDPISGSYILRQQVGNLTFGEPIYLSQEEYFNLLLSQNIEQYYKDKSRALDSQFRSLRYGEDSENDDGGLVLPSLHVQNKLFQSIFGGDKIELIPQGYASLDLGVFIQKLDNPQILPQNRNNFAIDLQQRIQMSVLGKVGENLQLEANYDTQAGFGFENRMNIGWRPRGEGGEDNIIQNIEFGNVSMPLSTSLITGAQSLFGAKGEFKFGNTYITTLFSQQESEARNITVQGGGIVNTFKIYAKDYQANQHYFLSQYFREKYDNALANYPIISSQINITRLEVWVIDRGNANQENRRAMVALRDLGDNAGFPNNGNLYNSVRNLGGIRSGNTAGSAINAAGITDNSGVAYSEGEQYLVHENVRLLQPSEYKFYPSLGYISLNQPMNDNELLGVSFQYTITSQPGVAYSVGEFSDQQSDLLITKLLKSNTNVNTNSPMWDLMMKNIYSLETIQLSPEDFRLNVFYQDPQIGSGALNYLPGTPVENETLIQLLNMDRLNMNGQLQQSGDLYGDGLFDYVPGITIDEQYGRVIFTTIEPFGRTIANRLGSEDPEYVLNDLYNNLPIRFEQSNNVNRYFMEGQYTSAGGDGVPLGAFNVPQGSVRVTANGQELIEGVDYIVDYQLGRVQIINQMLKDSGTPINISMENRSTFNMQTKRLMGLNVEHRFSEQFLAGITYMNYSERLAGAQQKAQYNAEPVSNSIFGANVMYNGQSDWLTRMTDKIPLIDTNVPSQISFTAEGAYLMPGVNNSTENQAYIDDFEDSQSKISLMEANIWKLASTPISTAENPNPDFDPSIFDPDDYSLNFNRRQLAWYNIDPRFFGLGGNTNLSNTDLSNHASRRVLVRELFSSRDMTAGTPSYLNTFDLTYFPDSRGPYNLNPNWRNESRDNTWAGISRPLTITNLIQSNVEYIEFWMMDPYADGQNNASEGRLLLHLGNVSEDILRDGNMLYENGINQADNAPESSIWGAQPSEYPILYSFQTEGEARRRQDVGLDGMHDNDELLHPGYSVFSNFTNSVTGEVDPAADNFVYYLDNRWDNTEWSGSVPNRYKYFRNPEGNSPSGSLEAGSATPDSEDINMDYNLDRIENYNQYTISLGQNDLNLDHPFIVDAKRVTATFENGQTGQTNWFLFRVPVSDFDQNAGAASQDVLSSARFMRMIIKGFNEQTTLRFATMDMVRSDWRRYAKNIYPNISLPEGEDTSDVANLAIGNVNIEENSTGTPPYMVPPGIRREQYQTNAGLQSQNEASMVLQLQTLAPQDARGVFKNTNLDLRRYKKLRMFTHVHTGENGVETNDLKMFIRLGSDLANNYYEYEIPMEYTPLGANSATAIWPINNMIDLNTDALIDAKKFAYEAGDLNRFPYPVDDMGKMIYVKGRPSLGNISTIMIGVRNSGNTEVQNAIVWVNELRLSEIDNEGGYAAQANLNVSLGDFAQINASGSITSVGFGALDRGPVERQQEEIKNYTLNTAVNLDKFLPEKWGLKIPFNYVVSEQFIDPKFNPLDNDIEFDEDPRKEQLESIVRTYSKQMTYGFSNIRKERVNNAIPRRFYDVENLTLSMLYNSDFYRDIYTEYNKEKNLRASLNYNYNFRIKYFEPFKNWYMVHDTAQSARYLKWVKELNLNPVPTRLGFRTDIIRTYNEQQYRDLNSYLVSGGTPVHFNPIFSNNFLFNWQYNIGFDLTKSLRLDFNSATRTLSDIPYNQPDNDMIWKNLFNIGRPVNYNQQLQVNWKTPLRLLPYFEWSNVEVGYTATYDWQARLTNSLEIDGREENIGNLGQNAQTLNVVGTLDFDRFYNQFKGFQRLDSLKQARKREMDSINRSFQNLQSKKGGLKTINRAKVKYKTRFGLTDYLKMGIASVKRGQFNFNRTSGIILPGMLAEPNFIGQGGNGPGPSSGFMFGSQMDIRRRAVENGWITQSPYLTEPYTSNRNETFTANLQIEPSPSLRINLNANRNFSRNMFQSGYNTWLEDNLYGFERAFENVQENFSISTWSIGTAFMDPDRLYHNLKLKARDISQRQGELWYGISELNAEGYASGLSLSNADVLVPAFLSAYRGRPTPESNFDYKRFMPLPNWDVTYTGLMNMPFFQKRFDRFEISHAYTSSYTVSGIGTNLNRFAEPLPFENGSIVIGDDGLPISGIDGNNNIYATRTYGAVTLLESFSPLIGVDVTLRNSMQLRAMYNKDRMISLSMSNYTLSEDYGDEFIFGFGYILRDVKMNMRYMGKRKTLQGDVNLRADLSMRDNEMRIRRILEDASQITGGQNIFSLKVEAQYLLSQNFNISLFYDQMMTKYKISTAFPLSTIRAGIRATFTFGN
ncbi:MAG: cell surface protein SprA [Flavobacteriaceae bacterium]|nr:cell surface protein SprA [Flavobacteriaceae bacterium]